jgi:serine protease
MHHVLHRAVPLAAVLTVIAFGLSRPAAQTPSPTDDLAFPLVMDGDQATAVARAFRDRRPYVEGEVLVRFRAGYEGHEQARALSVLRTGGAAPAIRWVGDTLLVRSAAEPDAEAMAEVLAAQPEVEWAQPNRILRTHAVPNDTSYSRQWNMGAINMPLAWDINPGGSPSVIVAVLDTGVATTASSFAFPLWNGMRIASVTVPFGLNPDLSASRIVNARDFAFWTGPVLDMVGHGTHVAGTVLQETNNNLGFAGVAYAARLMPVKVCVGSWELQIVQSNANIPGFVDPDEGGCLTSAVVAGIRYAADNGAQVINLSLGGPGEAPALLDALRYAVGRGAFVAISAGNGFEDGNRVEYPAGYASQIDGAMSVAAIGRSRRRAFYSSIGSHVEIAAPGGDARDGGGQGVIYQAGLFPPDSDPRQVTAPRFDRYAELGIQGTSMSSPHVAGVAALLYSQGITRPAAIEAALKQFSVDLGAAGRDNDFGYGLVDARAALRGLGVAR